MNTKTSFIGWMFVILVGTTIVLGGNYLIYTYIGMWNYIALHLAGTVTWILFAIWDSRNHEARMQQNVATFIKNSGGLIEVIKEETDDVIKHTKAFRD